MSTTGTTPAAGRVRGRCPGVLDPMETGDGWLLRVRVPGGLLTTAAMRTVAATARRFGSGQVDLTSRANLQLRGVAPDAVDGAAAALVDAGLALSDARLDAQRAIVASPLAGHDPAALLDTAPVVARIVARIAARIAAPLAAEPCGPLPPKFGVVVDDGGSWYLGAVDADVGLRAVRDGWAVRLRGADEPLGTARSAPAVVARATHLCGRYGQRMDDVAASLGADRIARELGVHVGPVPRRAVAVRPVGADRPLGRRPHRDDRRCNVIAAPFLGRVDAALLGAVAALADRERASVRLTTDHSLAFCGVAAPRAGTLLAELAELGLVVAAGDARSAISACVGTAGCAAAHGDTAAAARALVAAWSPPARLHLSGCAKGCGAPAHVHHLVADTTGAFR